MSECQFINLTGMHADYSIILHYQKFVIFYYSFLSSLLSFPTLLSYSCSYKSEGKIIKMGAQWVNPLPSAQVMISESWDPARIRLCVQQGACFSFSTCLSAYL